MMTNELELKLRWSELKVREGGKAHIIFEMENNTGKAIALVGYKMRNQKNKDLTILQKMPWGTSAHFQIILWNRDKHVFHWSDVDVTRYYGLDKGKWETCVIVGYIEKGSDGQTILQSKPAWVTIEVI